MATDLEQLVLSISADTRQIQRALKKLQGDTDKAMGGVEKSVDKAGRSLTSLESLIGKVGTGIRGFSAGLATGAVTAGVGLLTQAATEAVSSLAQIPAEAKRAGVAAGDFQALAYAAQATRVDIGALTDGLKEMNLRADEFVVTGIGPAAEAFARLGLSASEVKERLRDPADLFTEIIERTRQLGDTAAGIRIMDEIFGGTGGEQFVRFTELGREGLEKLQQEARDVGAVLDDDLLKTAGDIDAEFNRIALTVGTNVKGAIIEAAAAAGDLVTVLGQAWTFLEDTAIATRRGIGLESPGQTRATILAREELAAKLNAGQTGGDFFSRDDFVQRGDLPNPFPTTAPVAPTVNPLRDLRSDFTLKPAATGGGARRGGGGGGGDRQSDLDRFIEGVRTEIAEYARLTEAINTYGLSADAAETYARGLTAAHEDGKPITDELKASIVNLAKEQATAAEAADKLKDAQDGVGDAAKSMAEEAKGFVGGLISDLRNGASAGEAFANVLNSIADKAINIGLDAIFGGGGLAGIFGARAGGGSVSAGRPYMVGESGRELFVPSTSGKIVKNSALDGAGTIAELNVTVNGARGNMEVQSMVQAGVAQALSEYDRGLIGRLRGREARGTQR